MDILNFSNLHKNALQSAATAANEKAKEINVNLSKNGFVCVTVAVDANTAIGKALINAGFSVNRYSGELQFWSPSNVLSTETASIDLLEAGAEAYAKILREAGLDAYVQSMLDCVDLDAEI